jgi:hypothetical protein
MQISWAGSKAAMRQGGSKEQAMKESGAHRGLLHKRVQAVLGTFERRPLGAVTGGWQVCQIAFACDEWFHLPGLAQGELNR